jgi:WD40 repeat protein
MFALSVLLATQVGALLPSQGLAVSPNGKWLATSHGDHRMTVFDLRTGKQRMLSYVPKVDTIGPMLRDPSFSRDSSMLTSGSVGPDDSASPVWSTRSWKVIQEVAVWRTAQSADGLHTLSFSRSGRTMYGLTWDKRGNDVFSQPVYAIDLATGFVRYCYYGTCMAFSSDPLSEGLILKNGSGYRILDFQEDYGVSGGSNEDGQGEWIFQGLQPKADGKQIAIATGGKVKSALRIYARARTQLGDPESKPLANITIDAFGARAMSWIPIHNTILLAGLDGQVQIIDPKSKKAIAKWTTPDNQHLRGCAASPDGRRVYVGGDLGVIYELSARDLSRRRTFMVKKPASDRF